MKPTIHVITRALNRLEYTIQCVAAVARNTVWPNYRHLILTQGSSDGTAEWLQWIKRECPYYHRVLPVIEPTNYGDWGGMKYFASDAWIKPEDFAVQLDNDIEIPPYWLSAMMALLEAKNLSVVMLRTTRGGFIDAEPPDGVQVVETPLGTMRGGPINMPVACYLARGDLFLKDAPNKPNCRAFGSAYGPRCWKLWEWDTPWVGDGPYCCREIENSQDFRDGRGACLSETKYPRSNPQVWVKL